MRLAPLAALATVMLIGCGSVIPKSNAIRVPYCDSEIRMLETGAIIVGKRQVGSVQSNGKIVSSNGQLLAWVHEDNIRLAGGTSVSIKVDNEGTMHLPSSDQEAAKLSPVAFRVRKDGRMVRTKGTRGIEIDGAHSARNRRIVLALLLLTANQKWARAAD